ncbi:RAB GTPase activator [Fusarium beomiforme]|uniref:RAB GTPase activator n=1 Tax=Fusarium beomiforme TaxID=44412 RepID=A0A9P5AU87_9HYPO|nr:RAB GTPase activator [Fusarium beomiforme]
MAPLAISVPDAPGSPNATRGKFAFYGNRQRDSENSSLAPGTSTSDASPYASPMTSPSMSPLASPRVQIVPFGSAYRHTRQPSDESLSHLPPLPVSPRWDSLSNPSRFILGQSISQRAGSPFDSPHSPSPLSYDTATSTPVESRNTSPTFLTSKSSLADLRAYDNHPPTVENFSRPRKQSIRQPMTDAAKPRPVHSTLATATANANATATATSPSTPGLNPADQYLELVSPSQHPLWPPPRPRGPSVSSCQSSSTYHSVLSPPANDFYEPRAARARTANGATSSAARPPLSYSNPGSASPSPVVAPWMSGEEFRSSFRSQFTESTAPGTAVTERSSVLTKDSSVTSLYQSPEGEAEPEANPENDNDPEHDEPSLEDVMGMYEQGFDDDEDDVHYPDHHNRNSRRVTSTSDMDQRQSIRDDADDEDFPQRKVQESNSTLDMEIRMSKMIFTHPAFTSSVPHIAENYGRGMNEKRDSAKSLDSEPSLNEQASSTVEPTTTSAPPVSAPLSPVREPSERPETPDSGRNIDYASEPAPEPTPIAVPAPIPEPQPAPAPVSESAPPVVAPEPVEPIEPEDPDSRDRYGFKKENQYVTRQQYDAWNAGYTEYLARRRKKWNAYLKDNALMTDHPNRFPAPNAKTKRFVRKGIPPEWRGAAWFYYAGGPAILVKHSGLYDKLTTKRAKDVDAEAIERDLHRTFPDNIKFKPPGGMETASSSARESQSTMDSARGSSPAPPNVDGETPIITSLRRVLHAFAVYNPQIGYCQSLNFLAGLLLLFVDTEEQCFWLLNVITRIYLPGTHEMSLEGSKIDLGVLMTEMRTSMPAVWDKVGGELEADPNSRPSTSKSIRLTRSRRKELARMSTPTDRLPPITLCMTAWFMSCFIGTLPIETTLRVWDVFFYEGSKTLFRIALAIFKLGENEIRAVADPMEMFGVVQSMPRRLIDANALMEACFKRRNGFGHLSQVQIDEKRQQRRAKAQLDRVRQGKTWNN